MSDYHPHGLEAIEFDAENQPLDIPAYDKAVAELRQKVRNGEVTLDEATGAALDILANAVFPTKDNANAGR